MLQYMDSKSYIPKGTEEESIKKLHKLRNEFIHFIPKGWLLYINGMPQIVLDCMSFVKFLAFDSFNFLFVYEKDSKNTKLLIKNIEIKAKEIQIKYDSIIQNKKGSN